MVLEYRQIYRWQSNKFYGAICLLTSMNEITVHSNFSNGQRPRNEAGQRWEDLNPQSQSLNAMTLSIGPPQRPMAKPGTFRFLV